MIVGINNNGSKIVVGSSSATPFTDALVSVGGGGNGTIVVSGGLLKSSYNAYIGRYLGTFNAPYTPVGGLIDGKPIAAIGGTFSAVFNVTTTGYLIESQYITTDSIVHFSVGKIVGLGTNQVYATLSSLSSGTAGVNVIGAGTGTCVVSWTLSNPYETKTT
jgi:hypothetical protein